MAHYREIERKFLVAIGIVNGESFIFHGQNMSIEQAGDSWFDQVIAYYADEYDINFVNEITACDMVLHSESPISISGSFGF